MAAGTWLLAGLRLLLAVAFVGAALAGLGALPGRAADRRRSKRRGEQAKVRGLDWVDRLYPATPAGGVAARTLRYWRRDPRYVAGIAGFLIAPVILIVAQLANPDGSR